MLRVLVETGFLLALNPRDKNHDWAISVLDEARRGHIVLNISPAALIELSLYLKSRGMDEESIEGVFEALEQAILTYTRPRIPSLSFEHVSLSSYLRGKYDGLTFFDSLHASISIIEGLIYYDLDGVIKRVVENETK